jgi:phosphoglycolate phosphatase-like HAD superfamily hydrolase
MIGDAASDVEAAAAAGCDAVWIRDGDLRPLGPVPTATDLLRAVGLLHPC